MNRRNLLTGGCLLFFLGVVAGLHYYAMASRITVSPPVTVPVASTGEIAGYWERSQVSGRLALVMTRRLNGVDSAPDGSEFKYIETALHRGVVRKVLHVLPDAIWPEVAGILERKPDARKISSGYAVLFDAGRVEVMPLSQCARQMTREPVLMVIDPSIWSLDEKKEIRRLLQEKTIFADILVLLRAEPSDMALFGAR